MGRTVVLLPAAASLGVLVRQWCGGLASLGALMGRILLLIRVGWRGNFCGNRTGITEAPAMYVFKNLDYRGTKKSIPLSLWGAMVSL